MTLYEFVVNTFEKGIELFADTKHIQNEKGIILTRDTKILRECSLGLISTNTPEEWYIICKLKCPVGTIIEPFDERWTELYYNNLMLCRNELTKALLSERNQKSAKTLLDILERRDSKTWAQNKTVDIKKDEDTKISINIVGI